MEVKIGVIGLGYVGLPVALAFAEKFPGTVGFDINGQKISALKNGIDETGDLTDGKLQRTALCFTSKVDDLKGSNFFVVAVPTPVDTHHKPDFSALVTASEIVGSVLQKNGVVVYESTVYPGVTEEVCGPVLAKTSGLQQGVDFKLGYSPERINPGDKEHTLEKIIKIVSGEDEATQKKVAAVYEAIIPAGVHLVSSIKVAEAAKVIENTQRDLNIALMNELAIIFDKMNLCTKEVLEAAGTKWNFLKFSPGLVGGHCIGVDPFYLTTKAEQLGYHPQVILAGRRINDGMGSFIAQRTVKLMANAGFQIKGAKVAVLGLTFKENVSDIRNSRVPDIVFELRDFGVIPLVHDPVVKAADAQKEYGISLTQWEELQKEELDGIIVAVAHQAFKDLPPPTLTSFLKHGGILVDVKSVLKRNMLREDVVYWSL